MILSLALRYQKQIALFLLSISFVQLTIAERIGMRYDPYKRTTYYPAFRFEHDDAYVSLKQSIAAGENYQGDANRPLHRRGPGGGLFIGGPTQPESQSFTSVNSNNMVDLFSG